MVIAIPAWIDENESQYRPTEILIPVEYGIGPVWDYQADRGGWFARVRAILSPLTFADSALDGDLLACSDLHSTEAEAWECAELLTRLLVDALTARGPDMGEPDAT